MGQEAHRHRDKDEEATGRDIPGGDGLIGQEDIDAIDDSDREGKPTGQDHSMENHRVTDPDHGVGAIQDRSDTTSDIARISD